MKLIPDPQFTPEQEVLLWAIRVDHTKDQRVAEFLIAGVDWVYIRETAIQHGIIPLLYKRLKGEMVDLVPPDELSSLAKLFLTNSVNNLYKTQQLLKCLDILSEAGIETLAFKGPALAFRAYGDLSMRSYCDLDILIHSSDFPSVYKILTNKGFIPKHVVDTRIKRKLLIIQEKELQFFYQNIVIEIHWNILEKLLSIPLDQDQVWNRSVLIFPFERKVRTLSLEDTVILSCIHGTKHVWSDLKWLPDLAYLISNHPEIIWEEIFDRAGKMGVQRIVLLGLFLAKEHCGIRYLPAIENRFDSDTMIQNLAVTTTTHFFKCTEKGWFYTPPRFYLKSREGFCDRMTFISNSLKDIILEFIIPDNLDYNVISLPDPFFPLYVIIRPFRIFKDYCFRMISSALQKNEDILDKNIFLSWKK